MALCTGPVTVSQKHGTHFLSCFKLTFTSLRTNINYTNLIINNVSVNKSEKTCTLAGLEPGPSPADSISYLKSVHLRHRSKASMRQGKQRIRFKTRISRYFQDWSPGEGGKRGKKRGPKSSSSSAVSFHGEESAIADNFSTGTYVMILKIFSP
jgi:hypothetical protein